MYPILSQMKKLATGGMKETLLMNSWYHCPIVCLIVDTWYWEGGGRGCSSQLSFFLHLLFLLTSLVRVFLSDVQLVIPTVKPQEEDLWNLLLPALNLLKILLTWLSMFGTLRHWNKVHPAGSYWLLILHSFSLRLSLWTYWFIWNFLSFSIFDSPCGESV